MNAMKRPSGKLTAQDFAKFPVWRFTSDDTPDETYVSPVRKLPVKRVDGCIIGCKVHLANGTALQGVVANLNLTDPRCNEHFLALSVFGEDGDRFRLARYHDVDFARRGPDALAAFLRLPISAVFPITYDVSDVVSGRHAVLRGVINAEPNERLTRKEIISLALATASQHLGATPPRRN
jgi:hypothetical protein